MITEVKTTKMDGEAIIARLDAEVARGALSVQLTVSELRLVRERLRQSSNTLASTLPLGPGSVGSWKGTSLYILGREPLVTTWQERDAVTQRFQKMANGAGLKHSFAEGINYDNSGYAWCIFRHEVSLLDVRKVCDVLTVEPHEVTLRAFDGTRIIMRVPISAYKEILEWVRSDFAKVPE